MRAMHEIPDGQALFQRIVNAIQPTLAYSRKIKRGFAEDFAWQGAGVDARSSQSARTFDHSNAFPEVSGLRSAFFARGTGADYDKVILLHTSLPWPLALALRNSREQPAG